jgi:hypothetical protein
LAFQPSNIRTIEGKRFGYTYREGGKFDEGKKDIAYHKTGLDFLSIIGKIGKGETYGSREKDIEAHEEEGIERLYIVEGNPKRNVYGKCCGKRRQEKRLGQFFGRWKEYQQAKENLKVD